MMLDWNGYQKEVLGRVADLGRLSPDIVRGYRQLSDAGRFSNDHAAMAQSVHVAQCRQEQGDVPEGVHHQEQQDRCRGRRHEGECMTGGDQPEHISITTIVCVRGLKMFIRFVAATYAAFKGGPSFAWREIGGQMNKQPRIKRILAATDLDECATRALEHAKTLARRFDAEIMMVHAVPVYASVEPLPITPIYFGQDPAAEQQAAATALDEYRKTHLAGETASAPILEVGDPATAILATSRSREADLIVMGTHGRSGVKRALLGSVAEQVIAESDIPVLTVRCGEASQQPKLERILCPVNYNNVSAKALRHATLLASAFEAELVILHLIERADGKDMGRELEKLRDWVGDVSLPARARVLVQHGQAAAQVIEYAEQHDVDLIVLGAERKGRGAKSVLGSTTDRVTRHARFPVLTVPATSFDRDLRAA